VPRPSRLIGLIGSFDARAVPLRGLGTALQWIPLTDDERAAVEDGATAVENLLERLADVPTPAGPTPRQLAAAGRQLPVLDSLPIRSSTEGA